MSRDVWVNGCFDSGLHAGHVMLLNKARSLAGKFGKVLVGLDSDQKIKQDKGQHRPYYNQQERKQHLNCLTYPLDCLLIKLVNEVFVFDSNEELYNLIKKHKPDIIVKGKNWEGNAIGSDLCEIIFMELNPPISLTNLETKILQKKKSNFNPNI